MELKAVSLWFAASGHRAVHDSRRPELDTKNEANAPKYSENGCPWTTDHSRICAVMLLEAGITRPLDRDSVMELLFMSRKSLGHVVVSLFALGSLLGITFGAEKNRSLFD